MNSKKKIKLNKAEKAAGRQSPKRVSRKTIRRRRAVKRTLGLILVLAVVVAAVVASMKLLFVVRSTQVTGSNIFTEKEILDFLAIPQEENIFTINSDRLSSSLVEEFTYIESVQVNKRLPDRIEIQITDCTESFYTTADNSCTVYSQGFKQLRNSTQPPVGAVWLDIEMDNADKLDTVKKLLTLFEKYSFDLVTGISVSDDGMIFVTYDNRFDIDFGTMLDIDYKIKMCKKVLDEKIPTGEKGTIDATEGGEVVYKRQ